MSRISLYLQSFDSKEPTADPGPSQDFLTGWAEGYEKGRSEVEADQHHLRGVLVQAISDLEFPFSEARQAVLEALAPLFCAIIEGIAPHLSGEALAASLAARLLQAAQRDSAECVVIHVAQQDAVALGAALASLDRVPFRIVPDPALRSGEAIWSSEAGETSLDFATVLAEMRGAITALTTPSQMETPSYG